MKVALVHELLTMRGGAERVLRILAEMFPDAPIYTLLYDEKKLGDWFPPSRVRTSCIQPTSYWPLATGHSYNHHLSLRQFPHAVEHWDFSEFDLVISTSSAFVHGIITNGKPKHISIINSPARYLWDRTHDVMKDASKGPLGFFKKKYVERIFHKLRIWDAEASYRADQLLAASKEVQRRIELYWRQKSDVLYPPIDDWWLSPPPLSPLPRNGGGAGGGGAATETKYGKSNSNFLIVSTLVPYKRIDLAIEACNNLQLPLTIVGEGPDRKRLESLAGETVKFLGYADRERVRELYASSAATIFPGDEDFGLVPVESMASGTPVIAYKSGGALETILEGTTGAFFSEPTSDSLQKVLQSFDHKKYSSKACMSRAQEFSRERFETELKKYIDQTMKS